MESPRTEDRENTELLLARAAAGDESALAAAWQSHLHRLRRMVRLRLDRRLQGRVDPSDVLQEAYLEIRRQLPSYAELRPFPAYVWLRLVTGQRLLQIHRRHLGAARRDASREISLHGRAFPRASSASLAARLLGRFTSASAAVERAERRLRLEEVLDRLDPIDREILALRHFEELTNGEAAAVLGLSKTAASNRYVRALARLREQLEALPGFLDATP